MWPPETCWENTPRGGESRDKGPETGAWWASTQQEHPCDWGIGGLGDQGVMGGGDDMGRGA